MSSLKSARFTSRLVASRTTFSRTSVSPPFANRSGAVDKETVAEVAHLIRNHMFWYETHWTDAAVRRFIRKVGLDYIPALFALRRADNIGSGARSPRMPSGVRSPSGPTGLSPTTRKHPARRAALA